MNHLLSEKIQLEIALVGANQNGALTSRYFELGEYRKCVFCWQTGAMATGVTSVATVQEAETAAAVGTNLLVGKTATITAHAGVVSANITCAASIVGDHIIINGLTFTAAAAEVLATRTFDQSGGNNPTATSIAACVNDAVYGVPGVTAVANAAVVTFTIDEPGSLHLDITEHAVTLIAADILACGFVEIDAGELTANHHYVALTITNSAASQTSAMIIRGDGYYQPSAQYVAASDT